MTGPYRLPAPNNQTSAPLSFSFNGKQYQGRKGDTLASALMGNGVRLVARSFKYHRPRGILSAGAQEPNALLTLGDGAYTTPNTRATDVALYNGLVAKSQNHRGPLGFDLLAINDYLSPFLSAGFYYKTFMWPRKFWESLYEPAIRAAAGLGQLSGLDDPDMSDKGYLHCDLLIIGAGPAGLLAALIAGRNKARVILADEDFRAGGHLSGAQTLFNGENAADWVAKIYAELESLPNVRLMQRTTVFGAYDHGIYGAFERCREAAQNGTGPRQTLWRIYSRQSLLCTGALERSIAFPNNDRPGIMLSGAVRTYCNRFGVAAGKRVTVLTNNHDGWQTAHDLASKGVEVAALLETRAQDSVADLAPPDGVEVIYNARIHDCSGTKALSAIQLENGRQIETDCLAVSGGWNPNLHLSCHHRGRPVWEDTIAAFIPDNPPGGMRVAGAAAGIFPLGEALKDVAKNTQATLNDLGLSAKKTPDTKAIPDITDAMPPSYQISALWSMKGSGKRAFVDFQNDVTTKDIAQAALEGFDAPEHLKRYTTLGMATDQGKTGNVTGLGVLSEVLDCPISETGTTIFRPPYTAVDIAAFAGRSAGKHFRPTRLTPSHRWAEEQGAVFVEAGAWLRAQWYPKAGETHWRQSVDREVTATRSSVGICDVSTLGKIDIQGRDAAAFLNFVYANGFAKLAVGRVRYGLMLREDGIVMDDGTTARLSDHHFVMTTTTANAGPVFRHMEYCRQCLRPELDVHLISTTDGYAQYAVAGPNSRKLLEKLVDSDVDISNEALPYMGCKDITICNGIAARLFRISFSGELAYEIAVTARYGDSLIRVLMEAGEEFDVTPYGTEALGVMRIEKGHPVANELNGQTSAHHLGLGRMTGGKKDFIGKIMSQRPGLSDPAGLRLMGFSPVERSKPLNAGAHFLAKGAKPTMANDEGWMTSACHSPTLGYDIGLGFLKNGQEREGEIIRAYDPIRGRDTEIVVCSPHFYDPEGSRLRD